MHPVLTQVPPKYLRSTRQTDLPAPVRRPAREGPAWPAPTMMASKRCMAGLSFGLAAAGFVEEPDAAFGFVDPILDQAGGGDVAMLVAQIVDDAHAGGQRDVLFAQFGQHVVGGDVIRSEEHT